MSKFPEILRKKFAAPGEYNSVKNLLKINSLNTVCESAKCPNRFECFNCGTATFLILGSSCTRKCRFCAVDKGDVLPPDNDEPRRVADAVNQLRLKYVVITSVTRDDLNDGGAAHFAECISKCRDAETKPQIEILIPDLMGDIESLEIVLKAKPDVLNHNIETVPRLYQTLRPQAEYKRSLDVLKYSAEYESEIITKSGIMVGLGETEDEVINVMEDLRKANCSILTIGQYLRPDKNCYPVQKIIDEETYKKYNEKGIELGFKEVVAGAFVRSSYKADKAYKACGKFI